MLSTCRTINAMYIVGQLYMHSLPANHDFGNRLFNVYLFLLRDRIPHVSDV
jgi:hypothetical protein